MMFMLVFILICFSCPCVFLTQQKTCTFLQEEGILFADCRRLGLSRIPRTFPQETIKIDLSYNSIHQVNNYSFQGIPNLKYLNLNYNRITRLAPNAFAGLPNLEELCMDGNDFEQTYNAFPVNVFLPVRNLKKLFLMAKQPVKMVPDLSFVQLRMLEEFYITVNSDYVFGEGFKNLTKLSLLYLGNRDGFNCPLSKIQNSTFKAFRNSKIVTLVLDGCHLSQLEPNAFMPLSSLKNLMMPVSHPVGLKAAMISLKAFVGKNMTRIDFSKVQRLPSLSAPDSCIEGRIITSQYVFYLVQICLENLDLSENKIELIQVQSLLKKPFIHCIKYINLKWNSLHPHPSSYFLLQCFSKLRYLDISNQLHYALDYFDHITSQVALLCTHCKRTETISLNFTINFPVPPCLEVLHVDGSSRSLKPRDPLLSTVSLHFKNATRMKTLTLAYSGLTSFPSRIIGLENLQQLDISGNDVSSAKASFFEPFTNLISLSLRNTYLTEEYLQSFGRQLFEPLGRLQTLDMSENNLRFLPLHIFSGLKSVETIILSRNKFQIIPVDLDSLPQIKLFNLSYNSISWFDLHTRKELDRMRQDRKLVVSLQGNILSCGCKKLDFIHWLATTEVELDRSRNYTCITEEGTISNTNFVNREYEELWVKCHSPFWLFMAVTAIICFVTLFLGGALIRKYWTRIQVYVWQLLGRGIQHATRDDFRFDAYVAYCDKNVEIACGELRRSLEDTRGLKLFIKDRDTDPGDDIAEKIIEGINSSWKTVILVTPDFLEDHWAFFTMSSATYAVTLVMPRRIILLLLGPVAKENIPDTLLQSVDEDSIIRCSPEDIDCDGFWDYLFNMIIEKVPE